MIVGSPGDDILIAGRTTFDVNDDAVTLDFADKMLALLAEWNSGHDLATRMANIGGTGTPPTGGLNGDAFLINGISVMDSSAGDKLVGSSGNNWYFDINSPKGHGAASNGKSNGNAGGNGGNGNSSDKSNGKSNAGGSVTPTATTPTTPVTPPTSTPPSTPPGDAVAPVDLSSLPPTTPVVPTVTHGKSDSAPGKNK